MKTLNLTSTLQLPYQHSIVLPFEQGLDSNYVKQLYENNWYYTIPIGILYLIVIKYLEAFMKNRQAIKCKNLIILWNGILAIFSIIGLLRSIEEMHYTLTQHSFYHSICYSYHQDSVAAYWFLFFSFSKIWELGDTVFLVLRKRQLSFLHCYHHITVLIYTFQSGSEILAAGRWFISMNFIAHSAMYLYYTLTSIGYRLHKYISATVTLIQITQMIGGVLISCTVLGLKLLTTLPCHQTNFNLSLCFSIYISYFYLFVVFFKKAYLTNCKNKIKSN